MRLCLFSFLGLFAGLGVLEAAPQVSLEIADGGRNHLTIEEAGRGEYIIETTGNDPYFHCKGITGRLDPEQTPVLAFEYFCPDGVPFFSAFYGPPIIEAHRVMGQPLGRAESWQPAAIDLVKGSAGKWTADHKTIRLDFGRRAGLTLRIRNLQLRPRTAEERKSQEALNAAIATKEAKRDQFLRYLEVNAPGVIDTVAVGKDAIKIQGKVAGSGSFLLAEILTHQSPWETSVVKPEGALVEIPAGPFAVTVDRRDGDRDRITSRWCVLRDRGADGLTMTSHAVYPTDVSQAARYDLPEVKPHSIKGMGGVNHNAIIGELNELGVDNVTVNVVVNRLIRSGPGDDTTPFRHAGKTWHINERSAAGYDRLMAWAKEHEVVVSAIILITFGGQPDLGHPEALQAGHFPMPNLTQRETAEAYGATLAFLAQRYNKPGCGYGRFANWILHNEVDFGWEWTNMGEQPMAVFMDHYVRSMRLAYLIARATDPHARVFISLTHHWDQPISGNRRWKDYRSRQMLELLALMSRREGDFEWGVAYHPYPTSLFKADTWNDTRVAYQFDTPLITMKNIEVLEAYLAQQHFLHNGQPRGVLLSEQGFHTDRSYSDETFRQQSAAFVYTWHKIRALNTIETFHNHRWIDAAGEGGLLLGIRTLASPGKPFGEKKPAWHIYGALDTPNEAEATAFTKDIIGVRDFREIPWRKGIKPGGEVTFVD